jgi:stress-induced morphogen
MTNTSTMPWETKRTDETRHVEDLLRQAGFQQVDAYRYNSASIRLRIVDPQFEGLSREERDTIVEPHIAQLLPEDTQADITTLFTFAPSEIQDASKNLKEFLLNTEFEDPSPSML